MFVKDWSSFNVIESAPPKQKV